jgi:hypothetical protein
MSNNDDGNDESQKVGYKKPPRGTQFKKGQSGNPLGRSNKKVSMPNLDLALAKELSIKVRISDQNGARQASKFDLAVKQLVNKAASGHLPSLKLLMPWLAQKANVEEAVRNDVASGEAVEDVRARIFARLQRISKANARGQTDLGGK